MILKFLTDKNTEDIIALYFLAAGGFYKVTSDNIQIQQADFDRFVTEWKDCKFVFESKYKTGTEEINPDFFDLEESFGFALAYIEYNNENDEKVDMLGISIDGMNIPIQEKLYTVVREFTMDGEKCTIRGFHKDDMFIDGCEENCSEYRIEVDCYSDLDIAIRGSFFNPEQICFDEFDETTMNKINQIVANVKSDKDYMKLFC